MIRRIFSSVSALATLAALLVPLTASADYKAEALARVKTLENKFVSLAEAMPQSTMTYRPMEGVRSVSEEYLHAAAAAYGAARLFGVDPPASFSPRGYEKSTTDKAKVVAEVKAAFANLEKAVNGLGPGDEEKTVTMFRREMSQRAALWNSFEHLSEHLGKSISNARASKVVPPWTAARQARQGGNR